jgi:hypothetical protein
MSPLHDYPIGLSPLSHLYGAGAPKPQTREPKPQKQVHVGSKRRRAAEAAKREAAEAAMRETAPALQAPAGSPPFGEPKSYVAEVCAALGKDRLDGTETIDWNRAAREAAMRTEAFRQKARQEEEEARQEDEKARAEAVQRAAAGAAPSAPPSNAPAAAVPPGAGGARESEAAPPLEAAERASWRWTCDKLALHVACPDVACRRARACRGDPQRCLCLAMEFYAPQPLYAAAVGIARAHKHGRTAEQAFAGRSKAVDCLWSAWTGALQAAADARR